MINTTGFKPAGNYLLVKADKVEEKTSGGLYLPETSVEVSKFETATGVIADVGPSCYAYSENFADGERYEVGQKIMFTKFSGRVVDAGDGERWLAMKDDAIVGVWND